MMKTAGMRRLSVGLLLIGTIMLLIGATPAQAAGEVTLQLQAPERLGLGDTGDIAAVLRDGGGAPVGGATILLWTQGSFLSTLGAVELGRAVTDAQGKAVFAYQGRSEGVTTLNATFAGDSRYGAAQAAAPLTVQGVKQLYVESAGIRVRGISVWLLAGILSGVWGTYFSVMVLLTLIARSEPAAAPARGGRRRE